MALVSKTDSKTLPCFKAKSLKISFPILIVCSAFLDHPLLCCCSFLSSHPLLRSCPSCLEVVVYEEC